MSPVSKPHTEISMKALNGMGFVCDLCQVVGGVGDELPPLWITLNFAPVFAQEPRHVCVSCVDAIVGARCLGADKLFRGEVEKE